jgi:hypothetical protein
VSALVEPKQDVSLDFLDVFADAWNRQWRWDATAGTHQARLRIDVASACLERAVVADVELRFDEMPDGRASCAAAARSVLLSQVQRSTPSIAGKTT